MTEVIAWVTFAGAWLLVAGPPYHGSVELDELDVDREGIEGIKAAAVRTAQGRPSAWWWWWWLLPPPVMYVLHCRWTRAFRQATLAQLTQTLGHRSSRPTRLSQQSHRPAISSTCTSSRSSAAPPKSRKK